MNNIDWEFSKEVEPDLIKLLEIVNHEENKEFQLENGVFQLFPEYQDLQKDLEKELSFVKNNETSKNEEQDIIVINDDSNDSKVNNENEIKIEIPLLNLTQKLKKQPSEEIINEDTDQFINYLQECLENESSTSDKQYITKLINDFNEPSLLYLFNKLSEMSNKCIHNLNKSLCTTDEFLNDIPKHFCKIVLFQKLQNKNSTNKLLPTMKEFSEKFSEVTRKELLNIFLVSDSENNNFYQTIITLFSNNEKLLFLRDFVLTANEIQIWQLSVLDSLLIVEIEDNIKSRLLNLMEVSADRFKNEKLFMKLLTSIINILEADFEDQIQIISNIIEKSKAVNKISAQNALKKWVTKFNSQYLL